MRTLHLSCSSRRPLRSLPFDHGDPCLAVLDSVGADMAVGRCRVDVGAVEHDRVPRGVEPVRRAVHDASEAGDNLTCDDELPEVLCFQLEALEPGEPSPP